MLDLTESQQELVKDLLKKYIPNTAVWAYGSRVKGTSTPKSDLDIAAFTHAEQKAGIINLREAFEESNLPFRVDLFVWDEVPAAFRKNIEREHVVLQQQTP
ncbi:MAG: nucleotidyltransferase domain-containing protein [Heliobacteriaceae bacterium]|jgi:type I restriction enzyme S subunit|nr:nucleotidyltransferase domain-containing protein [Heliobacteriaceae bacterium]